MAQQVRTRERPAVAGSDQQASPRVPEWLALEQLTLVARFLWARLAVSLTRVHRTKPGRVVAACSIVTVPSAARTPAAVTACASSGVPADDH